MKLLVVLSLLVVIGTMVSMVTADLDSMESDDMLEALLLGGIMGNGMSCVEYGKNCMGNQRCCQYRQYSQMGCQNGMCLQTRCASINQRCNRNLHCCYHEGLTCYGGVCRLSSGK